MPHINRSARIPYDAVLNQLPAIGNKGELEYCIARVMMRFMRSHCNRYADLHDCAYAAVHCGEEFKRLFLDRREDAAMKENGSAFELAQDE